MTDKTRRKSILPEGMRKTNETEDNPKPQTEGREESKKISAAGKPKVIFKSQKRDTTGTPGDELESLKKRKAFDENHTRITTYLENEVNAKVREKNQELSIPLKELINKALKEFFEKHNF